jgi:hypothetical protein
MQNQNFFHEQRLFSWIEVIKIVESVESGIPDNFNLTNSLLFAQLIVAHCWLLVVTSCWLFTVSCSLMMVAHC